ncbi:phosphomannomutase [Malassezia cuniculi]|uniref:Phosphomannomutase n=1 Tax=Malassezia cuniculi TaxID=948313 RepID=A0AAF0ERN9_9BASI|nr:phosphomannomutase [Malassezia cuniculi]
MVAVPFSERKRPNVLCLFDVDKTLTPARQLVSPEMLDTLRRLREVAVIGFVGGSDINKIGEQLQRPGEPSYLDEFDYGFGENGLTAYRLGEQLPSQSFINWLGEDKYKKLVKFCLSYISQLDIPVMRGTFVEFRKGMINERDEFEAYDKEHNIREQFVEKLKAEFPDYGLSYSIGGQISFDVFPTGWDKTYALNHIDETSKGLPDGWKEIHFFGDKTFKGGNDYEIYEHPDVIGHSVTDPDDTIQHSVDLYGPLSPWHQAAQRVRKNTKFLRDKSAPQAGALGNSLAAFGIASKATENLAIEKFTDHVPQPSKTYKQLIVATDCGDDTAIEQLTHTSADRDLTDYVRRKQLSVSGSFERDSPYWERRLDPYKGINSSLRAPVATVNEEASIVGCERIADPQNAAFGPQRATEPETLDVTLTKWIGYRLFDSRSLPQQTAVNDDDKEYRNQKVPLWMLRCDEPIDSDRLEHMPHETLLNAVHYYASAYYQHRGLLSDDQPSKRLAPADNEALLKYVRARMTENDKKAPPCAKRLSRNYMLGLSQNMICANDDTALVALATFLEEYTHELVRNTRKHKLDTSCIDVLEQELEGEGGQSVEVEQRINHEVGQQVNQDVGHEMDRPLDNLLERPRKKRYNKAALAQDLAARLRERAPNASDNIAVVRNFSPINVVARATQYFKSRNAC